MRLRTAERLKESQNTAAMLTTFNEIDMSNIMGFRKAHKDAVLKKHDVKLGFMSAFMKASAWALQQEPSVNACTSFLFLLVNRGSLKPHCGTVCLASYRY